MGSAVLGARDSVVTGSPPSPLFDAPASPAILHSRASLGSTLRGRLGSGERSETSLGALFVCEPKRLVQRPSL